MHNSSYWIMKQAVDKYLDRTVSLSVMDLGSYNVNGTYRSIFVEVERWRYLGVDMVAGPNVDLVVDGDFAWKEIPDASYDVVVSGQVMEHVKEPWTMAAAMGRVCKPGGFVFVVAPNTWEYHPHPLDCWRVFPDGMGHVMTKYGGFSKTECGMNGGDTFFFGRKI